MLMISVASISGFPVALGDSVIVMSISDTVALALALTLAQGIMVTLTRLLLVMTVE